MPMVEQKFDREKHVYRDQDLAELLRKAVQFFNGTPVMALPLGVKDAKVMLGRDAMDAVRDFNGLGVALLPNVDETRKSAVYALYCRGTILRHGEAEDVMIVHIRCHFTLASQCNAVHPFLIRCLSVIN